MADPKISPPRSWGHTVVHTACPLDCPDSCSLDVTVERGASPRSTAVDGAPSTDGYICGKVRRFDRRVYSDERILHPAVRTGPKGAGEFSRVTWDEALDLIAEKMTDARDRFGAESCCPTTTAARTACSRTTSKTRDSSAGSAPRGWRARCARRRQARPPTAIYGKMAGVAYRGLREARTDRRLGLQSVRVGHSPRLAHQDGAEDGAKLVVIDPRTTPLARTADLHWRSGPARTCRSRSRSSANCSNAVGPTRTFLRTRHGRRRAPRDGRAVDDRTRRGGGGHRRGDLRTLAEWYGTISPARHPLRMGPGAQPERRRATMAILALPAVAGKFGVRGGGYTMSNSGAWGIQAEHLIDVPVPSARVVNMNQLGRALTEYNDPPVSVLFVYNCNPVATVPDQNRVRQGLDARGPVHRRPRTGHDGHGAVRGRHPAGDDVPRAVRRRARATAHITFSWCSRSIAPVGESRPNHDVFRELGVRLGLIAEGDRTRRSRRADGARRAAARSTGGGDPRTDAASPAPGGGRPIQFVDVVPNTAGRPVALFPADLASRDGLYRLRSPIRRPSGIRSA